MSKDVKEQPSTIEKLTANFYLAGAFLMFSKVVGGAGSFNTILTAFFIGGVVKGSIEFATYESKKEVPGESWWQKIRRKGNPAAKAIASTWAAFAEPLIDLIGKQRTLQPGFASFILILGDRALRSKDKIEQALLAGTVVSVACASGFTAYDKDDAAGYSLFVGGVLVGTLFAKQVIESCRGQLDDKNLNYSSLK